MKTMKKLMALAVCAILLLAPVVLAQGTLTADFEGGAYCVRWQGIPASGGTLTIYINGWPAKVCNVGGPNGEKCLRVERTSAKYSARLATAGGCLTVDGAKPVATPTPTAKPTATPAPTAKPTATPVPTAKSTATPKPTAAPVTGTTQSALADEVVRQVNAERAKEGLKSLSVSAELTRAARVRAGEIVTKFSHTRPDGSSWSTVSSAAYGENIAMGQRTADKVMAAWMSSPGHRDNILRASFGSIGVCAYVSGGVTYWVQLFGK